MSNTWQELPYWQRFAIAYTPKPVALVSCVVSTMIAIHIFRDKEKMGKMYHRLTLGMCISGALDAINIFLMSWAIPLSYRDDGYIHASGTVDTCTASGFLLQLGLVAQYYYVSLSIYVFMALKHEFRIQEIEWIEKYLHIGVFIYPLSSAIYLSWREMFNPVGVGCWINSYPQGCTARRYNNFCKRGVRFPGRYVLWFGAVPSIFNIVVAVVIMCACYVNEQIKHKRLLKSGRLQGKQIFLERARREKSMLVAKQGACYIAIFVSSLVIHLVTIIVRLKGKSFFPAFILTAFFLPCDNLLFSIAYIFLLRKQEDLTHKQDLTQSANSHTVQSHTCLPKGHRIRRRSFSIFDASSEEKWKMFGVYVGDDSDRFGSDENCDGESNEIDLKSCVTGVAEN